MKTLFALFFLLISFLSLAQVKDVVPGSYGIGTKTVKNYIKNPYCFANTKDIVASDGASVTKTSSSLEGESSCAISSSGAGGKVKFSARALDPIRKNGQCLISFAYSGDGTKWKGYVESNSIKISNEAFFIDSGTNPQDENYISYSCGDLSSPTYFVLEALGTAPVFKLSSVSLTKDYLLTNQPATGPRVKYNPVFQGFGTPSNVDCEYNQDGPNLILDCLFTPQSDSASPRIGLPSGLTIGGSWTGNKIAGTFAVGSVGANKGGFALMAVGNSYITLTIRDVIGPSSAGASSAATLGSDTCSAGAPCSVKAIVPIAQYASSVPTYTGKCTDPRACETVFSAKVSAAGVVTSENLDFINGNAVITNTATYDLTFNTSLFSVAPSCTVSAVLSSGGDSTNIGDRIVSISNTNYIYRITGSGAPLAVPAEIVCQRQGQDYINAKTLQQNVALKNYSQTNLTTESMSEEATVLYNGGSSTTNCTGSCNLVKIGDAINSITRTAPATYLITLKRIYSTVICSLNTHSYGVGYGIGGAPVSCTNCSSLTFVTARQSSGTSADNDSMGVLNCKFAN